MRSRKNRSVKEWQDLVLDYKSNYQHQSKVQYCMGKGISSTSFCKWYNRLSKSLNTNERKEVGSFVSLKPSKNIYQVKLLGIKVLTIESHV